MPEEVVQRRPAVLIVEDDPGVREMACDMFSSFGLECFDAYNAERGFQLLLAHPEIRLLFSDVRMPGMNGAELAREALRIRPELKVVLTSGWVDSVDMPDLRFVPKPYRVDDVEAIVREVAGTRDLAPAAAPSRAEEDGGPE
jgi:DNA-binding NtrC family response regulator